MSVAAVAAVTNPGPSEAREALVFLGPGRALELVAVPEVLLGAGELIVEVELATVCGSDLHTISGHRRAATPLVLGHEQVGRVRELGPGRAARTIDGQEVRVGDRIVWSVAVDCGRCRRCRLGLPQKCATLWKYGHERIARGRELTGGFASHVQLRSRTRIARVSEGTPAELLAPASCATATVMAALDAASEIRQLGGATLIVSGCGMLGLTAVAAARAAGATVVAIDPDGRRRARALELGAAEVADARRDALAAALAAVGARHRGATICLELSGAAVAIPPLVDALEIGGVLVLVGSVFPQGTVAIDPEHVVRGMLVIRGVHNYRPQHLLEAVRFLESDASRGLAELVGASFSLAELGSAIASGAVAQHPRVAVRPR